MVGGGGGGGFVCVVFSVVCIPNHVRIVGSLVSSCSVRLFVYPFQDGVLMLEAPVKVDQNQSLTLNESGQVGVRPKSDNQIKAVPASQALVAKGERSCD